MYNTLNTREKIWIWFYNQDSAQTCFCHIEQVTLILGVSLKKELGYMKKILQVSVFFYLCALISATTLKCPEIITFLKTETQN